MIRTSQLISVLLSCELIAAGCSARPDPELGNAKTEKARLAVVLSKKTCSHSGLGDNQLNGESRGNKDKLVPPDIIADLQRRNPGESLSLANLKPRNANIVVEDLSDKKESELEYEFNEKYPDARGYVKAWLPGFSKDGNTAVVRVRFGPSAHGATATYMLIKQDGRWRVKWRRTAYKV